MTLHLQVLFAAVLCGFSCSAHAGSMASFTLIPSVPSSVPNSSSYPADISSDGTTVVGYSHYRFKSGSSGEVYVMPFRWTEAGGFEELIARDSNRSGFVTRTTTDASAVIGYDNAYPTAFPGQFMPYRWTESGGYEELGLPHPFAQLDVVYGVADDGATIVGYYRRSGRDIPIYWTDSDGYVPIDVPSNFIDPRFLDISADGQVVVAQARITDFVNGGVPSHTMRWTESGGFEDLFTLDQNGGFTPSQNGGFISNGPRAISPDGSVIVGLGESENTTSLNSEAFRWTAATGFVGLGDLSGGSFSSSAYAVSDDGRVVGGVSTTDLGSEGMIWDELNGMRNLREVLLEQGADVSDWMIFNVTGLSHDGSTVIGQAYNIHDFRQSGFIANITISVPEPGAVILALPAVLLCLRRRS